jgi:leucyl aminopeptidase
MAEQLDAYRKARQAEHSNLTMTGIYNVLEKLRSGEALTPKEQSIHEQVRAVRDLLEEAEQSVTPQTVAQTFTRARKDKVIPILETLVTVGRARLTEDGRFVGGG